MNYMDFKEALEADLQKMSRQELEDYIRYQAVQENSRTRSGFLSDLRRHPEAAEPESVDSAGVIESLHALDWIDAAGKTLSCQEDEDWKEEDEAAGQVIFYDEDELLEDLLDGWQKAMTCMDLAQYVQAYELLHKLCTMKIHLTGAGLELESCQIDLLESYGLLSECGMEVHDILKKDLLAAALKEAEPAQAAAVLKEAKDLRKDDEQFPFMLQDLLQDADFPLSDAEQKARAMKQEIAAQRERGMSIPVWMSDFERQAWEIDPHQC